MTQSPVDSRRLVPMTDAGESNMGRQPEQLSADAGYCSQANLAALETRGIESVAAEWGIVCTAHNLLKLAQGRALSAVRAAAANAARGPKSPSCALIEVAIRHRQG